MRNQTSFRLTTTVLPTDKGADHKAKVTQVINKVNESGEKYYPTFTEETVVLTNDDRTIMETVRAVCNNGVMEFVKRGLNDTEDATEWQNRALTWNPGTLCFITAGASDWIDKDDDITWTGDQTYTGDLISTGSATYRGLLTTEKGVQYPSFENLAALEAYQNPFAGMFAVLESDGELYRYNAVTQQRDIVTTSTPAAPEKATTSTIGTVRVATDTEFNNGTATGSQGESLMATVTQIKNNTPVISNSLHVVHVGLESQPITKTTPQSISYTITHPGFITIWTNKIAIDGTGMNTVVAEGTANPVAMTGGFASTSSGEVDTIQYYTFAVDVGTVTITGSFKTSYTGSREFTIELENYFYFG